MATEWWASLPGAAVPCRRQSCGHRVDLAPPFSQQEECKTCGDVVPFLRASASRDLVPCSSATLTWEWATRTKGRPLKPTEPGALLTVEHLAAAVSAPQAGHLHLPAAPLRSRHRPQGADGFLVSRTPTTGCAVHAGTVELPERGVLLLAGAGAHFHGTTFTGGVVMCAGARFSGTFDNCTFRSTALYAVHAAAVTLRSCHIAGAYTGLVASGEATMATLSDCRISYCSTSIVAERGGTLAANSCAISQTDTAVVVNDDGSRAELARCVLAGGLSYSNGAHGITTSSAGVSLHDCHITGFIEAVRVAKGPSHSTVEAEGLRLERVLHGVLTESRARLTMRESDICVCATPVPDACPVAVSLGLTRNPEDRGDACMQMERCDMSGMRGAGGGLSVARVGHGSAVLCRVRCSDNAASIYKGGRATLAHCTAVTASQCLAVHDSGSVLRLHGGCYEGVMACAAEADTSVTATDCVLRTCRGAGEWEVVSVLRAATVRLLRCHIDNGRTGVSCKAGTVYTTDTTVSDIQPVHIEVAAGVHGGAGYLVSGGHVTVTGGTVEKCSLGLASGGDLAPEVTATVNLCGVTFRNCVSGVKLTQPGGEADVRHCDFQGINCNRRQAAAAVVAPSGEAGVSDTAITFTIAGGGRVSHCTFAGFRDSISVCTPDAVAIRDCTFQAAPANGLYITARGPVAIDNCSFKGHPSRKVMTNGVYAGRGGACTIRGCRMDAMAAYAVVAASGSSVKLLNTTIHGCGEGLTVRGGAQASAQDCKVTGGAVGIDVAAGGGSVTAKRMTIDANRECVCVHCGDGHTVVKLVDSVLSGSQQGLRVVPEPSTSAAAGAVDASTHGQDSSSGDATHATTVSMLRCDVSGCRVAGVWVCGPAAVRLKSTRVSRCMSGIMVGEFASELATLCRTCGRSGPAAVRHAFEKLQGGAAAAATARCVHEGAIARLRLDDCEVVECENYAVVVNEGGHVAASGVTAIACHSGILVRYVIERSVFSGCRVVGCAAEAAEVLVWSVDMLLSGGELNYDMVRMLPEVAVVEQERAAHRR